MKTVDQAALEASFGSVKGAIGCDEVASLEVDLRGEGGALRGQCPLPDHHGDSRSFYCYASDSTGFYERWHCFRCALGGDVVDLYGHMFHLSHNSVWALQALAKRFNLKLWSGSDFQTEAQQEVSKQRKRAERRIWRAYEDVAFKRHIMPIIMEIEDEEERARTLRDCLRAAGLERRVAG